MKYRYKRIKLNWGILLPIYILLWPLLSMLVQVDALIHYIDSKYILIDSRLFFYILALGACVFKLIFGNKIQKQKIVLLFVILVINLLYLVAFIININNIVGDYKQFFNGFFLFSILCSYAILYFDLINWELCAKLYALSLLGISIFGLYAFSRFIHLGREVISGSYSEQLFRLAGGKAFFLPCVFILAFIFFEFKYQKIKSIILPISLAVVNLLIIISSQRNAITIVLYELITFSFYYSSTQVASLFVLIVLVLFYFKEQIFLLIQLTLITKFRNVEISTEESRLDIWGATINALISDIKYIIFGVSDGGLPSVSGSNWPMVNSSNPHNILLYFWQATGLAGLISIICVILVCAYFIHKNKKLHQILFYWLFVSSLIFVGFAFYDDSTKTDLLNIGIVLAFSMLLRKQNSNFSAINPAINQDSSRFNEGYS